MAPGFCYKGGMRNRRQILTCIAGFGPLALFADGGLGNSVVDVQNAKLSKEAFGDLRIYYDGSTAQLKAMTAGSLRLKPGMSPHPPHEHPEEEFMVVTEGTGEISVEGQATKVSAGSMMFCGAGKLHGIVNTGKTVLTFYFYKWRG
jgi:mannose-6-phosphate isomerase-like protein (cupin superfamily)